MSIELYSPLDPGDTRSEVFKPWINIAELLGDAPSNHPQIGSDCGCVERDGWWWVVQGGDSDLSGGWLLGQGGGLRDTAVNQ